MRCKLLIILFFLVFTHAQNSTQILDGGILDMQSVDLSFISLEQYSEADTLKGFNADSIKWIDLEQTDFENFKKNKCLLLRIKIKNTDVQQPALLLAGYAGVFSVYYKNILLFKLNDITYRMHKHPQLIPMPNLSENSYLYLFVKYQDWYKIGGIDQMSLDNVYKISNKISDYTDTYFRIFIVEFIQAIILSFFAISSILLFIKGYRFKFYPFLYFALFSITAGIEIGLDHLNELISGIDNILVLYIELGVLLIIPLTFVIFIEKIFGEGWKNLLSKIRAFHIVFAIILYAVLLIDIEFLILVLLLNFVLIIELILVILVFFKSKFHQIKKTKAVYYSLVFFTFLAVFEVSVNAFTEIEMDISLYGFGIIIIAFAFFNYIMNIYTESIKQLNIAENEVKLKDLEVAKLKSANIESQYEALKTQINPHFLFNTFSTLISLIDEKPQKASEFVQQLSNVYRYVLQSKDYQTIEIQKEIDFLYAFIFLLKMRFDKGIIFNINIPIEVMNKKILPLSLQMLIENCIKHNIVSEKKPLHIDLFIEDEFLIVKNNSQKKSRLLSNSIGIGLKNIEERYRLLSNKEVKITDNTESFSVYLPIINEG